PPANFAEFVLAVWPTTWSFGIMLTLVALSVLAVRAIKFTYPTKVTNWLLAWLFWVMISPRSLAPDVSGLTLVHFFCAFAMFFIAAELLPTFRDAELFFR